MGKKTLAFFSPTLQIGGVEKVFITLANQLCEKYDVTFILKYSDGSFRNELSNDIKIVCTNSSHLRYAFFSLARILYKYKFDYVFAGTLRTNILLFFSNLFVFNPSKIIAGQHNYLNVENSKLLHERVLPYVLNHVTKTIAVSEKISEMLLSMGVRREKVCTIPNPINIKQIETQSMEDVNVPKGEYVVFVGRIGPVKNLPLLLNAFCLFVENEPNAKLLIIGDGPQRASLINYTKEKGMENCIIWMGSKSNPYPYIKNSRLVVLSSLSEAFPVIVLESFCLGKTILSTNNKGAQYILRNGELGYIVDTFTDSEKYCKEMQRAWNSPLPEDMLKKQARRYDVEMIVKDYEDIIL